MNEFKPSIGVEFNNKYIDAKNKLVDFIRALDKLTPTQKRQLSEEFMKSMGIATSLEQFIKYMNNGGRV